MSMVKKILYLTFSVIGVIFLSLLILFLSQRSDFEVSNITGCQSDSQLMVYCEFSKPEDIVVLPDERHLLISEFGAIVPLSPENLPGKISLFDTELLEKKLIEITLGDNDWGEKSCKRDDLMLSPHGIDLNQRSDGRYQLAVVNHMPR